MHRYRRAIFGTDRIRAMVTGNRKGISKDIMTHTALSSGDEATAVHFIHAAKTSPNLKVVFVFTGHLTRFTARTTLRVNEEP